MEDALVHECDGINNKSSKVLILVLMEDALVHASSLNNIHTLVSLNPCFNGRCTRTSEIFFEKKIIEKS